MTRDLQELHAPDVPSWFEFLAKDSLLNESDVCKIFNFKKGGVHSFVRRGTFPAPDVLFGEVTKKKIPAVGGVVKSKVQRNQWRKSTILREIARRKILASQ